MGLRKSFVMVVGLLAVLSVQAAEPPASYVDAGVCPFECCTYGSWTAIQDVTVFDQVEDGKPVAKVHPEQPVHALTGDVHIRRPGVVEVRREHESAETGRRYLPGDKLYVYTYQGEGYYKVWFEQAWLSEEIPFLAGWAGCEEDDSCWGEVLSTPESRWWVRVRLESGLEGWVDDADGFFGKDACG